MLIALSLLLLSGGFYLYSYAESQHFWKATDPADPQFNKARFQLKDYDTAEELEHALEILLPLNSSKAAVDDLLVSTAGAYESIPFHQPDQVQGADAEGNYIIGYYAPDKDKGSKYSPAFLSLPGWEVWIYFNNSNHLTSIDVKRNSIKPVSTVQRFLLPKNENNFERKK